MKQRYLVGVSAALLLASAGPSFAHHSFVADYDPTKAKVIEGTVTKLEWTNPHARFYVAVPGATGAVTNWEVEMGSPNTLLRYGWKRDTLQVGSKVEVDGYLARDLRPLINAKTVKFADGRTISAGSSSQGSGGSGLK